MNRNIFFIFIIGVLLTGCGASSKNYSKLSLVKSYINLDQQEDAKIILEKMNPRKEPDAYYYLGKIYFDENNFSKAKQNLENAVKHSALIPQSYCLLAQIGMHSNDANYSKQMFLNAFEHNSNDAECFNKYGLMAYSLGMTDQARSAFCQAIKLDKNNLVYSENLKSVGNNCVNTNALINKR